MSVDQAPLLNALNHPTMYFADKSREEKANALVQNDTLTSPEKRNLFSLLLETLCINDDSITSSNRRDIALSLIENFSFKDMAADDISGPFLQTLYRVTQKHKKERITPHEESLVYLGGVKQILTEVLDAGRRSIVEDSWKNFIERYPNVYQQQVIIEGRTIDVQLDDKFPLIGKMLGINNHRDLRAFLLNSYERAHGVLKQMYVDLGLTSSYQQKQTNKLLEQYGIRSRRG